MNYFLRLLIAGICMISLLFTFGCAVRLADLTMISTKNVTLDKVDLDSLPQTQGVVGKDEKFIFAGIPLGFPHLEEAIDDALEKGNGDMLIDSVIYSKHWDIWIIGQNVLEVKGTVVKSR